MATPGRGGAAVLAAAVAVALCAAWLLSLPTLSGAAPESASRPAAGPVPKWIAAADRGDRAVLAWLRDVRLKSVRVYRITPAAPAAAEPAAVLPPTIPAGFVFIGETAETTYTDATVAPGGFYRYRLTAVGADGKEGPSSPEMSVRIAARRKPPPEVPVWLGYLPAPDGVTLKWGDQQGADVIAYNLYRKVPSKAGFGLVNSVTGTSFTDKELEPGKSAVYAVTALDSSFVETPLSKELAVQRTSAPAQEPAAAKPGWWRRRTRLVAMVSAGDRPFSRPADVAVGPRSGNVYVTDSGLNRILVFSPRGAFLRSIGAGPGGPSAFQRLIGLGIDRDETLCAVDAGRAAVFLLNTQGGEGQRLSVETRAERTRGLADCAVGAGGRLFIVDNSNDLVLLGGRGGGTTSFGEAGFQPGQFSAPTFCATDSEGNLVVADSLNGRVQVFSPAGEFQRAFGRRRRGAGGLLRPKGVAVAANGEVYVADSWQNAVQVFTPTGQLAAVLTDENGNALDLGSPNGIALGAGNMIYIAERLSARLQIREIVDEAR